MRNKKTVMVLGPPRSGTSMTAGILQTLGVEMNGIEFPTERNPKGHFEDRNFIILNKYIIDRSRRRKVSDIYWDQTPSIKRINKLGADKKVAKKITKLISERGKNSDIWGWKDPSTSSTLELFLPYIEYPFFVITTRDFLQIHESARQYYKNYRENVDVLKSMKILSWNYERIISLIKKYPSIPYKFVSYEETLSNPKKTVKELTNFLKLKVDKQLKRKAVLFVIPRKKKKYAKRIAKTKSYLHRIIKVPKLTRYVIVNYWKQPNNIIKVLKGVYKRGYIKNE